MHLRSPSCRGAHYGTDQSAAPHGQHEFFPHPQAEAIPCPGWTAQEDAARLLDDTDAGLVYAGYTFEEANAESVEHGGEDLGGKLATGTEGRQ